MLKLTPRTEGKARAVSPAASSDAFRKRRPPSGGIVAFNRSLLPRLQLGMGTRSE